MIFLFHSYFTLRVKKRRYIGKKYSPAKGVGRVYRREGSNPSFSAKKPENAEFSGFFDALNLLLLQMPKNKVEKSWIKWVSITPAITPHLSLLLRPIHFYFTLT